MLNEYVSNSEFIDLDDYHYGLVCMPNQKDIEQWRGMMSNDFQIDAYLINNFYKDSVAIATKRAGLKILLRVKNKDEEFAQDN